LNDLCGIGGFRIMDVISKSDYEKFIDKYDKQQEEIKRRFKLLENNVLFGTFDCWGDLFEYKLVNIINKKEGTIEVIDLSVKDYIPLPKQFITNILNCYFDEEGAYERTK
jgi:hypothetical protein